MGLRKLDLLSAPFCCITATLCDLSMLLLSSLATVCLPPDYSFASSSDSRYNYPEKTNHLLSSMHLSCADNQVYCSWIIPRCKRDMRLLGINPMICNLIFCLSVF